jgi:plasmid maintenance system killer protein
MVLKKHIIIIMTFFSISVSFNSNSPADDRDMDRATLRGIQSVIVNVSSWESEWSAQLKKVGLEESVLQSRIEHKLEKAGIPVLPEEFAKRSKTEGVLNIRVQFLEFQPERKIYRTPDGDEIEKVDTKKKYIYAIRLNFRQTVMFPRDPALKASAITWQTEFLGLSQLAIIKEDIMNVIDVFVEAYLSENHQNKTGG